MIVQVSFEVIMYMIEFFLIGMTVALFFYIGWLFYVVMCIILLCLLFGIDVGECMMEFNESVDNWIRRKLC